MRPDQVVLEGAHGKAQISLLGATVLSWVPPGQKDLLWVSADSRFQPGTAIRGGIPVCWPWFASDPAHPAGPSHGLVRAQEWTLIRADASSALLSFVHQDASVFPPFVLELEVQIGRVLTLALTHHNLSNEAVACTGALHTYLRADASCAQVCGLGRVPAYDKVRSEQTIVDDPIRYSGKTDMVVSSLGSAVMEDGSRRVAVHRMDAPDLVLWNPGDDRPNDVPDGAQNEFVCVEAAAVRQPWMVQALGHRTLTMQLELLEAPSR